MTFCGVCCTVPPTRIFHNPGVDATNVGPNVIAITSTRKAQTPATMKYHIGTIVETVFELYPARKFVHRNSATSQNTITATGAFHVFSHFA